MGAASQPLQAGDGRAHASTPCIGLGRAAPEDSTTPDLDAAIERHGKLVELYMKDSDLFKQLARDNMNVMYALIRQRQEARA